MVSKQKLLNIIKWLSLAGIFISGYSLYEYYYGTAESLCNINATFSCLAAYQSGYAAILGVPLALWGIIGFGFIFVCAAWSMQGKNTHKLLLPLTTIAFLGVLYLAYVSAFIIRVWCPTCIATWAIIVVLFVLSLKFRNSQ